MTTYLWIVLSGRLSTRGQRGSSVVEYALITAGVALGLIFIVQAFQLAIEAMFRDQASSMESSP